LVVDPTVTPAVPLAENVTVSLSSGAPELSVTFAVTVDEPPFARVCVGLSDTLILVAGSVAGGQVAVGTAWAMKQ
jgi:hypothetical protein